MKEFPPTGIIGPDAPLCIFPLGSLRVQHNTMHSIDKQVHYSGSLCQEPFSSRGMSLQDCKETPTSVGPWGGQHGLHWDDGGHSTVRQIIVTHGSGIDSIQVQYEKEGSLFWSNKHGGAGGKTDKVQLNHPEEFLTAVHGYYGTLYGGGPICIRSLTFKSNKKTYGPFGVEQGTSFSIPTLEGKIVGFHGTCGWHLESFGAYLMPPHKNPPTKSLFSSQNLMASGAEKFGYSVIQGRIGNNCDIVLAIKPKKDNHTVSSPTKPSRHHSSSDSSDGEKKEKISKLPYSDQREPITMGHAGYGPWGGQGGTVFDDGTYTGIRQIHLSRNTSIVWIKVLYEQNGLPVWGHRNGGTGGYKTEKVVFDYPFEVLTHITGFHGPTMHYGPTIIKSLTFHTSKGKHGPYGEEHGSPFTSNLKEGEIVGFHGRKGLFLDAIGVHVVEGKVTPPVCPPSKQHKCVDSSLSDGGNPLWPSKHIVKQPQFDEFFQTGYNGVVKKPVLCGMGPWGGDGGRSWDDGTYTGIRQIVLTRSDVICSIQIEYDQNGQSAWSTKHGASNGINIHRVKLEYPNEVVTCITGYSGAISKDEHTKVIKSLTFYTSRGKFGPYGEEKGSFFSSTTTEGKVVGFHGTSGMYVDAIGVHMQHWLGAPLLPKPSLFKIFH